MEMTNDYLTGEMYYKTIESKAVAEFKDRGSRFISYAFPILCKENFKSIHRDLLKEHPKAVHHCFAYRIGFDGNDYRSSDNGEPAGSAGKPILGQIDSKGLTNVLIIVVRYFGGTLLGVPGLINAYKSSAALSLQVVPIIQKPILTNLEINFDYRSMNDVMKLIKVNNSNTIFQELNLFCKMIIETPKIKSTSLSEDLKNLEGVEVKYLS